MLRSIPLYFAAASRPLVLQLGPAERTTIFWNCEIQVKRAENKIVASGLLKGWGGTHPESGVTRGVSRFRPELESWILVDITIRNDSEHACGSKVLKPAKRE
jgi:hypothetical protein